MKINSKWFTLIELLLASTLFFILVIMTYANYAFYQNIARVKLSLKEISQSINTAKNMAVNWFDKNWINQSIWIYFDTNNKNVIKFYTFNYNFPIVLNENNFYSEKKLQDKVWIEYISWKNNVLIYFSSIYWVPSLYFVDVDWSLENLDLDELDMIISFKENPNFPLKRELKYIKNTNVIDY